MMDPLAGGSRVGGNLVCWAGGARGPGADEACDNYYRNPIDNHGIAAMISSEMTNAPM